MTIGDDDATVRLRRAPPPRRRRMLTIAAAACVAALVGIGFVLLQPSPPPVVAAFAPVTPPAAPSPALAAPLPAPIPTPLAPPPPRLAIEAADETAILAAHAPTLLLFRYAPAPRVLVLSFPTLHDQGRMLNRVGAFVEKAGLPHDRVIDEVSLHAAMHRTNDTDETFYYGHDYRAADMARFLADAARDGMVLRPEEELLRTLLAQEGMLAPGAVGALISIPPESVSPLIDAAARATILHHELSHGLYFTDPAYAAYAGRFWRDVLTEAQRAGFRHYLASQDYDTGNEDLMINETQAYLVHTPDARYFRPELAGLSVAEANRLRRAFWRDMPDGWLKDATTARLGGG